MMSSVGFSLQVLLFLLMTLSINFSFSDALITLPSPCFLSSSPLVLQPNISKYNDNRLLFRANNIHKNTIFHNRLSNPLLLRKKRKRISRSIEPSIINNLSSLVHDDNYGENRKIFEKPSRQSLSSMKKMSSLLPWLPSYYEPSKVTMMPTTTHVFKYKNISYQMGIRHIHALEHLSDIHILSLPFFKIKKTSEPVTYGASSVLDPSSVSSSFTLISCECEIFGKTKKLRMFTEKPNESQIVCFLSEGIPHIHLHLTVTSESSEEGNKRAQNGHILTVVCTYYRCPRWFYMHLKPIFDFLHYMEDTCFWSYDFRFRKEDPNLAKYRRMVLYSFKKI